MRTNILAPLGRVAQTFGGYATFFLMLTCIMLPLGGIWLTWVLNAVQGTVTTFDWSRTPKGVLVLSKSMQLLVLPVLYLLGFHLLRYITVAVNAAVTSSSAVAISSPLNTTNGLEAGAAFILKYYSATYILWLSLAEHAPTERYWPFAVVLVLGAISYFVAKGEYVYGYNKGRSVASGKSLVQHEGVQPQTIARLVPPSVNFSHVIGMSEVKSRLLDAGHAITAPRKEGEKPRNGIVMGGDPGNGKTLMAEALAGELKLPFLNLSHSDVASQWVGERTVRIKQAFDQAIKNQPCMLFIDEIDSFLPSRTASTNPQKEDTDVVNSLLTLLVDIRRHRVVIVAATNHMDLLDGAAVREGRFDFKIEIPSPDLPARIGILQSGLKRNLPAASVSTELLTTVATRWNGFSVKRIQAVTEELPAYLKEMTKQANPKAALSFDDFMGALRRLQGQAGCKPENVIPLADMVLQDSTRNELNMIVHRLNDPVKFEKRGGELPTGALLIGPPGTGKTAATKAIAKEVGWAFLTTTGADMVRDPKALEKIFAKAKELRPTIIFIDEADELLRSREYSNNTESTNKLLTLMDGVNDRVTDVLWVAATNHPDQIDSALLRGGRFTEKVVFYRPTHSELVAYVGRWLSKKGVKLGPDLSLDSIAVSIGDQSIANAGAVLQYAVNMAISHSDADQVVIDVLDVAAAISTVLGTN